jgi:hypothetical protein
VFTFGFEENLVAFFVAEFDNFIFDRRTISRPAGLNLSRIKGCAVEIVSDQLVRQSRRARQVTTHVRAVDFFGAKTERLRRIVAPLFFQTFDIQRAAIQARRRTRLQSA